MNKLDNIIHKISINFVMILCFVIVVGMMFINSIYLYIDKPDFQMNNIWNYVGIVIGAIGIVILVIINNILKKKFPEKKYITPMLLGLYFIIGIMYVKLIPLKPFSDMGKVYDIAINNFRYDIEYLQQYPNNLPITIIFYLILKLHKGVMAIKILNIICNIAIIYFTYKTYTNITKKKNKLVLLLGITSISMLLYENCLYNDIIFTSLVAIIIYIATKEEHSIKDIVALSLLSFAQYIIRPVGIILIIAICMYFILKKQNLKIILSIILTFIICNLIYIPIKNYFIPKTEEPADYPIWSFIQMGINEEEFGFQNQTHSTEWKPQDVIDRIKTLGPKRLATLLAKKEYWLFTEGTYQVERYAFGAGQDDAFYYETFLSKRVQNPETSKERKAIDYLMKGQYFVLILLSLIDLLIKDKEKEIKDKKDLLLYFIIGMFCFYLIWEIKSRYIYCLNPIFIILATSGIEKLQNKITVKETKNGKI